VSSTDTESEKETNAKTREETETSEELAKPSTQVQESRKEIKTRPVVGMDDFVEAVDGM
jgi:hypothetical protein